MMMVLVVGTITMIKSYSRNKMNVKEAGGKASLKIKHSVLSVPCMLSKMTALSTILPKLAVAIYPAPWSDKPEQCTRGAVLRSNCVWIGHRGGCHRGLSGPTVFSKTQASKLF